jgi:hypothetical protein
MRPRPPFGGNMISRSIRVVEVRKDSSVFQEELLIAD